MKNQALKIADVYDSQKVIEKTELRIVRSTVEELPIHIKRKAVIIKDILGDKIGNDLVDTLIKSKIIFSPKAQLRILCEAIKKGIEGEEVVLTGIICPDYSYVETGEENIPFRYTFESVSDGVGLVAKQVARITPALVDFLNRYGVKTKVLLFIADFESNSTAILEKMEVDKETFVARCAKSLVAFKQKLNGTENVTLKLFEKEWCSDKLDGYAEEAYQLMQKGNFLSVKKFSGKKPAEAIKMFSKGGEEFYKNWYGEEVNVRNLVLRQASEYAAVGRIFSEKLAGKVFIQVAGDRAQMNYFTAMYSSHPVMCAEKSY